MGKSKKPPQQDDAATRGRGKVDRPLELLGIGKAEERTYRILLELRTATVADVARLIKATSRGAAKLLMHLEALGLVTHTAQVPRVYVAAPPELAVTALIKQRQAMLERVRVAIPSLEAHSARADATESHEPAFEVIRSRAHLNVLMAKIYESFRSEVMSFQRAPTLTPESAAPGEGATGSRFRNISDYPAGVRVRTISDNSILEIPGALAWLEADVARGEQARVLPLLPFKMMIFDRRVAVIALDPELLDQAPTLLIRSSPLLDAFCRIFEFVWERATPVMLGRSGRLKVGTAAERSAEQMDALLELLAVGFNDKAIALELGISPATLNRRMAELMRTTGTRTRFQLGWHAALATGKSR